MKSFEQRLNYALGLCRRRAGTKNNQSTRELCNCIETSDGDELIAELMRRAHRSPKIEVGVRLLFALDSINKIAPRFGVPPLEPIPKNVLGLVPERPFYIWANEDCDNKTDSFKKAKAIRLELINEGCESVHIVDANGVEVDAEIQAQEQLATAA